MAPKKLTREEELLLQDFGRGVTRKQWIMFGVQAAIVCSLPIWLFWRVWQVSPFEQQNLVAYVACAAIASYAMSWAYKNVKFVLKHRLAQKCEEGVSREMQRKFAEEAKAAAGKVTGGAPTPLISKQEKDERILWKKNEVADYEATCFAIFFNNALFLVTAIAFGFFVFRSLNPLLNFVLTELASAGLVAFLSTDTGASRRV